jgi:hypothetical protein
MLRDARQRVGAAELRILEYHTVLATAVAPLTVANIERKLQNYKPLKLTAFGNWLQYFKGRVGSSKQKNH